jgi:hypothetical protein
MPKWWNRQTHHLEGVAGRLVRVQVPPSAFFKPRGILCFIIISIKTPKNTLERATRIGFIHARVFPLVIFVEKIGVLSRYLSVPDILL